MSTGWLGESATGKVGRAIKIAGFITEGIGDTTEGIGNTGAKPQ